MQTININCLSPHHDKNRLITLYEDYRHKCFRIAFNITKSHELAEDMVHSAFIEIIKKKDKYLQLDDNKIYAILITIIKNKCMDYFREQTKRHNISIDEIIIIDTSPSVDTQIINQETINAIKKKIMLLSRDYQDIIELKYVFELTNVEISKLLNISKKNVEMRLYRSKKKLKDILQVTNAEE